MDAQRQVPLLRDNGSSGYLTFLCTPSIEAAIQQRCVIAMADKIERVISASRRRIPSGGIENDPRIVADAELLEDSFQLFGWRQFRLQRTGSINKVRMSQQSGAGHVPCVIVLLA